jgi:Spy/CpxP family protein refolding chaperone
VKERPRAIAVLITVFLLGCVLGSAGSYFYFRKYSRPPMISREVGHPPPHGMRKWPELLQMSQEQDTRFKEIMKESREKLDALSMDQGKKIQSVLSETNQKISSILDENQRKKFEELLKEVEAWRSRERRDRRFGPPPGSDRRFGPPPGSDRRISGDSGGRLPGQPNTIAKGMNDGDGYSPRAGNPDFYR